MKMKRVAFFTLILSLFALNMAAAQTWETVYETNFSSDPGWITNNSSYFYWEPGSGTYRADQYNVNGGGYYLYYDARHDGGSFRLEWDCMVDFTQYASGLHFGLFDTDLNSADDNCIYYYFANEDQGQTSYFSWYDSEGAGNVGETGVQWTLNTWYHFRMVYNSENNTCAVEVNERDSGNHLFSLQASGVGPFGQDMSLIGTSNFRNGTFQRPGAHTSGRFDNVSFATRETWCDGFENYPPGSSIGGPDWNISGNNYAIADNTVSYGGAQSVKMYGHVGGCWGAIAYRSLQVTYPFTIELKVKNGTEGLYGCHPYHASMEFKMGTNWWDQTVPGGFVFMANGDFWPRVNDTQTPVSGFALNTWHIVKGEYDAPGDGFLHVKYWVNDQFIGEFTRALPPGGYNPLYVGIAAQEGTVWFDDVCVNIGESCVPIQLEALWTAPEEAEMNTPYEISLDVTNPLSVSQCYQFSLIENALPPEPPDDEATWFLDEEAWANNKPYQATVDELNYNTHVYEIKHNWDWIPPWSPSNLAMNALLLFVPGGTSLEIVLAIESEIDAVRVTDFQYLGQVQDVPDTTFEVRVVVPWWKQVALVESHLASLAGSICTFIGFTGQPHLFLAEAVLLVIGHGLYTLADDPPDIDFEIIVQPEYPGIPQIDSLPPGEERHFAVSALHLYGITSAVKSSIEKYQGATLDGSFQWQVAHLEAAKAYSIEASEISQQLAEMFQSAVAGLEPLSPDELQAIRDSILESGLPEIEVQVLTVLGFSQAEIEDAALAVASISDEFFADLSLGPAALLVMSTAFSEFASSLPPAPGGAISTEIDIDPDVLNAESNGNFITVYLELPDGYDVAAIQPSSVMLNHIIPAEMTPVEVGDHDGDGILDLMVKFNRQDVISAIGDNPGSKILVVTGNIVDSSDTMLLGGADLVRVIDGSNGNGDGEGKLAVSIPQSFAICQNYPNPFNASTTIKYDLPEPSQVTIEIYDVMGRKVETLFDGMQPAGYHSISWYSGNISSGVYFYRIEAGAFVETRKMLLLK